MGRIAIQLTIGVTLTTIGAVGLIIKKRKREQKLNSVPASEMTIDVEYEVVVDAIPA